MVKKIVYYSPEKKKRVKQKIICMCSHLKLVSRLFLKNVKKINCIEFRKYMLFGGPAENLCPPTISQK